MGTAINFIDSHNRLNFEDFYRAIIIFMDNTKLYYEVLREI
jgi:hypothetical protein